MNIDFSALELRRRASFKQHFAIWVPSGRAINPISKTNWEGTGVKPDVDVPADQALKVPHIAGMKNVVEKVSQPEGKNAIKLAIELCWGLGTGG
ncbi:MAG: hypothetical protein WAU45_08910 [Blastocatellia bacterium]